MSQPELLLQDLALVLCVAAVVAVLFRLLRQPLVLGYLLAGIIVGPHVPIPLFADQDRIDTLSQLGVILVMFSIGLEFSIRRVVKLVPTSGLVGAIQLSGMLWLGYGAGRLFGWSDTESLFTGAMLAISSTMIVARTFADEKIDRALGEIVFGVLIIQDLGAVLILAVLTAITRGGLSSGSIAETAWQLSLFLVLTVSVGLLVVPRAVRRIAQLGGPETLLIASVGLCFAMALLAHSLGYSVALGAFLAGSLVSESGHERAIARQVEPLRDLFGAVFFIAIGMMVDPHVIADRWLEVVVLTALVLVAQPLLVSLGTFLAGSDLRTSIRAGMSLAQIGEFSFIIVGVGVSAGALRGAMYPIAVAVALLTSFATPWMVRSSTRVAIAFERRLPRSLQTLATLYGSWREELRGSARRATSAARIRRLLRLMFLDGALLALVCIAAATVERRHGARIAEQLGIARGVEIALVIAVASLLAAPFVVGLLRCASGMGATLAGVILPGVAAGSLDLAHAPRRAFVVTLQLAMALLIGLPVLALTQPFLPLFVGAPALAVVLSLLGVAFWRSAINLEEHVQAGSHLVAEMLTRRAAGPGGSQESLDESEAMLPGLGRICAIHLEEDSPGVGLSLADLDLRALTGATVIAIARGASAISPTGHEPLAAGDILSVTGATGSVTAARALLLGGALDRTSALAEPAAPGGARV